jgi:hypothetical protein
VLKYDIEHGHLRPFGKPFKVPAPKRTRAPRQSFPEPVVQDTEPLRFLTDSEASDGGERKRDCSDAHQTLVVAVKGFAEPAGIQTLRFEPDSDDALTFTVQPARPAGKRQTRPASPTLPPYPKKAAPRRAAAPRYAPSRPIAKPPLPIPSAPALQFLSDSD